MKSPQKKPKARRRLALKTKAAKQAQRASSERNSPHPAETAPTQDRPVRRSLWAALIPPEQTVTAAMIQLPGLIQTLQSAAHWDEREKSREAFSTLVKTFYDLLRWIQLHGCMSIGQLGRLSRELPKDDAWKEYQHGDHLGGWAGIELARIYKQFKAEIASRSQHTDNTLHRALFGSQIGDFTIPPNPWFRAEYDRKSDYRPAGRMAIWVARKIREILELKERRAQSRMRAAVIVHIHKKPVEEIEEELKKWCPSDLVLGQAVRHLDELSDFGVGGPAEIRTWRSFVRSRIVTNSKIFADFEALFPKQRRQLDGVIASTVAASWEAVKHHGRIIIPGD